MLTMNLVNFQKLQFLLFFLNILAKHEKIEKLKMYYFTSSHYPLKLVSKYIGAYSSHKNVKFAINK